MVDGTNPVGYRDACAHLQHLQQVVQQAMRAAAVVWLRQAAAAEGCV
jgi:hypothetical protein